MKNWFAKFRLSTRLDAGRPLSARQQRALGRSPELRQFLDQAQALGPALRQAVPPPAAPAGLHAAILHAVRDSTPAPAPARFAWWREIRRPLPAAGGALALVLLLAAGGWWWRTATVAQAPAPSTRSLSVATEALHLGTQAPAAIPAAVMAPLNEEMARLNQALTNTTQSLLAMLP